MHTPISIKDLSLSFPHKTCFEAFTTQIHAGSRIGIIGRNGSGKSTLLQLLRGKQSPSSGEVCFDPNLIFGYVPQVSGDQGALSGGERFNAFLTKALACNPSVLLLDEPTNHLDKANRTSLMRLLRAFPGTLLIVSHDKELLRSCVETLWHIDQGQITIFPGAYDDYMHNLTVKRASLEKERASLNQEQQKRHESLMKEQKRAAKSNAKGKKNVSQKKWTSMVGQSKRAQAQHTTGKKKALLSASKEALNEQLAQLRLPEILMPQFSLTAAEIGDHGLLSIREGSVGYETQAPLLTHINLSVSTKDRIALVGDNGSGKSTFVKALLQEPQIITKGDWHLPKHQEIGYLDQHYQTLSPRKTVLESLSDVRTDWAHADLRRHLNDFLFRKNEEVNALVHQISGGEKARLSLSLIAAQTPKLLILDEITNNLDQETCEHVLQVLKAYPGALIIISHDESFLAPLSLTHIYKVENGQIGEGS